MAFRRPLFIDEATGFMRQLSDIELHQFAQSSALEWMQQTSFPVRLSPVAGFTGNLGAMGDTRLRSGAALDNSDTDFPTESQTDEPYLDSTILYSIQEDVDTVLPPSDPTNLLYFAYLNSNDDVQAMSLQDMIDTFCVVSRYGKGDVIGEIIDKRPHRIFAPPPTSVIPWTNLGVVFEDTNYDPTGETVPAAGSSRSNPITVATYNLYRFKEPTTVSRNIFPAGITASGQVEPRNQGYISAVMNSVLNYAIVNVVGSKIRYNINGGGDAGGFAPLNDTILNGTGNFQTQLQDPDDADPNDYVAVEFPNGTQSISNTYQVKCERL